MCGLVGYVDAGYTEKHKLKSFLKDGLYVDALRGFCGTGVLMVDQDKEMATYKRGLPGPDFLNSFQGAAFDENHSAPMVAIGHNRAATMGAVSDRNSHPFVFESTYGTIGLAHNGGLTAYQQLTPATFKHAVDSAHAAYSMAMYGPDQTLAKAQGWFVFVWYDKKKNTFNIARNTNREIAFQYIKNKKGLLFASESRMLDWLAWRNDIELEKETFTLNENSWVSWELGNSPFKPKIKKIKAEEKVVTTDDFGKRKENRLENPTKGTAHYPQFYYKEDTIHVEMKEWTIYPGTEASHKKFGMISGNDYTYRGVPARIDGVSEEDWKFLQDYKEVSMVVTGSRKIDGNWTIFGSIREKLATAVWGSSKSSYISQAVARHNGLLPKPDDALEATVTQLRPTVVAPDRDVPVYVMGPNNKMVLIAAMDQILSAGCYRCASTLDSKDAWLLNWTAGSTNLPICQGCAVDPELKPWLEEKNLTLIPEVDN